MFFFRADFWGGIWSLGPVGPPSYKWSDIWYAPLINGLIKQMRLFLTGLVLSPPISVELFQQKTGDFGGHFVAPFYLPCDIGGVIRVARDDVFSY